MHQFMPERLKTDPFVPISSSLGAATVGPRFFSHTVTIPDTAHDVTKIYSLNITLFLCRL